ncbi:MAG: radical SAM protein [Bryobacteraceae bacterium]
MSGITGGFGGWVQRLPALPKPTQGIIAETLLNQSLELYINPTEHCNFRCKYCYEDFAKGRMPRTIVESVKRFVTRQAAGRKRFYLNWFGGEPLIASDIVLQISQHAKDVCESHAIRLSGSVTTNGWNLGPGMMAQLVSAGLTFYQITLDGHRESHDAVRVRADGKGTFDTIWNNLLALHKTDLQFSILLRVHLRPGNLDSVRALFYSVRTELEGDRRFVLGLHPLLELGGPTRGSFETLTDERCNELCRELKQAFGDELMVYGDAEAMDEPSKAEGCGLAVCYACKSNSFLIRSDGSIGKCTVALDKPFNAVGFLEADGQIRFNQDRFKKWTHALYTLDPKHLACPAKLGSAYFSETDLVNVTAIAR